MEAEPGFILEFLETYLWSAQSKPQLSPWSGMKQNRSLGGVEWRFRNRLASTGEHRSNTLLLSSNENELVRCRGLWNKELKDALNPVGLLLLDESEDALDMSGQDVCGDLLFLCLKVTDLLLDVLESLLPPSSDSFSFFEPPHNHRLARLFQLPLWCLACPEDPKGVLLNDKSTSEEPREILGVVLSELLVRNGGGVNRVL